MNNTFPNLNTGEINFVKSQLYIGTNVGKSIEAEIKKAQKFVYIISPYISSNKIDLLHSLNDSIDIKLVCSDKRNTFFSNWELSNFKPLFSYKKQQSVNKYKEECHKEKLHKLSSLKFFKYLYFLVILTSLVFGGFIFYSKKNSPPYLIFLSILFLFGIIGSFYSKNKIDSLDKKTEALISGFKTTNPPDMDWNEKIKTKIIRSSYSDKNLKTPYPHLKIYLMDCPNLSEANNKTVIKAFISSANFTNKGFDENLEFVFQTTDFRVTEQLLKFFNEMFTTTNFSIHHKKFIIRALHQHGVIFHEEVL